MATREATTHIRLTWDRTIRNVLQSGWSSKLGKAITILDEQLQTGVSTDHSNRVWVRLNKEIAPGNTDDVDLYDFAGIDIGGGAGKDAVGQDCDFEEITALIVHHRSGDGLLEIQSSLPLHYATWVPVLTSANGGALKAGGTMLCQQTASDGFDVTDGINHTVRFKALDDFVYYDMFVLGRHDDQASSSTTLSSSSSTSSSSSSSTSSSSTSTSLTPSSMTT